MRPDEKRKKREPLRSMQGPSLLQGLQARIEQYERALSPSESSEEEKMLDHPRWEIRCAALERLGKLGSTMPLESVERSLDDENCYVRMTAIKLLGKVGEEDRDQILRRGLGDADWQVRKMAVLMVEELDDATLYALLSLVQNDENAEVRQIAQQLMLNKQQVERVKQARDADSSTVSQLLWYRSERSPIMMNSTEAALTQNDGVASSQIARPMRRKRLRLVLPLVGVALLAIVLMGASIGWWNSRFGDPNLYTTIDQQQTHNGVTIRITEVYADEGRTVIAYDVFSDDATKDYFANKFATTGDAPQKQEVLSGTYGDGSPGGLAHFYSVQPAFLVEKDKKTLTLTLDIGEVLVIDHAQRKDGALAGPWHFVFTVPFHHTNNRELPDPLHGELIRG